MLQCSIVRKRDRIEPGSREKQQQASSKCVIVVARCLLLPTICGHYSGCTIYIKGMFNKPPAPENKVQTVKYGGIYLRIRIQTAAINVSQIEIQIYE